MLKIRAKSFAEYAICKELKEELLQKDLVMQKVV
jgi:hypothetical protein